MSQREVAALVLPYLEKENSRCVDMEFWASEDIQPHEDPFACGTMLCVAGWVAHVLGYRVLTTGFVDELYGRAVSDVARDALELTEAQADFLFLVADKETALRCVDEMADGLGFPDALRTQWRRHDFVTD